MVEYVKPGELRRGDFLNLEGDPHLHPSDRVSSMYLFAVVDQVHPERWRTIVHFTGFKAVGFPTDHLVRREVQA